MNTSAIVAMALTCGFIWGGFLVLLTYGIRKERQKAGEG
ncbi:MAG: MetS family NSS transporter small subunit [Gemmatimonadota bacterium]|nr:MAG: MetS family NSS transporter small subunit [Gemmatimonadota bacterium]